MLVYTKIFSFNTFWWNLPLEAFICFFETWIIYNCSILLISSKFNCIKEIILERKSHHFEFFTSSLWIFLLLQTQFLIEKSIELKLNEITQFSQFQKCQSSKNGYDRSMSK